MGRALVLLALALAAWVGWRTFWFLTDDAHITFRYIHNHLQGWGYTWNPPPFRPVEGYTNFLWMVLLEGVWWLFGVEPPASANVLSLLLSYGTLALGFLWVLRLSLPASLGHLRFALAAAVVAATLTNRTFLAWMSSGLETALFTFSVTLWCVCLLELSRQQRARWLVGAWGAAAVAALTRPDGMLLVGGTGLLWLWHLAQGRRSWRWRLTVLPALAVVGHLAWRRSYYGEWLPNTYYAKHAGAWPESGWRYAASFVLEYGLALWLAVAVAALGWRLWRERPAGVARRLRAHPEAWVVVAVLLAHAAWYTLIIGGDHFEYRVYAHLVLPLWVTFVALLAWLPLRAAAVWGLLGLFLAVSLPLPWVHWWQTRTLTERGQTYMLIRPIASHFPGWARPYVAQWDALQAWLIPHFVCMRHQEHKVFYEHQLRTHPSRAEGLTRRDADRPVLPLLSVGVPGWVLPEVAVLDTLGLNDYTVARTPLSEGHQRHRTMAHDRTTPPGYVDCFSPNARMAGSRLVVSRRQTPLSEAQVQACETRFLPPPPGGMQASGTE